MSLNFFQLSTEDAQLYGVNEALILQQIKHFVEWAKNNKANEYEGRHWTYNSIEAWAKHFGFLTTRQIKYALDNLIKKIDKCKELLKGTNLKPFLIIYAKYDG